MDFKLEVLEPRIAPATLIDAGTVTYQDTDGDAVTVKFSKNVLDDDAVFLDSVFSFDNAFNDLGAQQLQGLTLTDIRFKGISVSVTVEGNASVDVGAIEASGISLGKVTIDGDLGKIVAGSDGKKSALRELNVGSMGMHGTATQGGGDLNSVLTGGINKVLIAGNAMGVNFSVEGSTRAGISMLSIGGSLLGAADDYSGRFTTTGAIGKVDIGTDIFGGIGDGSGSISAATRIGNITIGNSLSGNDEAGSGDIYSGGNIGKIFIGNDIEGGDGKGSGRIRAAGNIASLTVLDDIVGGDLSSDAGSVRAGGRIGNIFIGGDLTGSAGDDGGNITAGGAIASLTIEGSMLGGDGDFSSVVRAGAIGKTVILGDLEGGGGNFSGHIFSEGRWTSVRVEGSLTGNTGLYSGHIYSFGNVGSIYIGGGIVGGGVLGGGPGTGGGSVNIDNGGNLGSLFVGTDGINGGPGESTGRVDVDGNLGKATILGDVRGGLSGFTGQLSVGGQLRSLALDGSLIGTFDQTGTISSDTKIGKVFITGDVRGGGGPSSGRISSGGDINSLTIQGSVIAGGGLQTGSIQAEGSLKKLVIEGDIRGFPDRTVLISAVGKNNNQALNSIFVGGQVGHTVFQAGALGSSPAFANADAKIGKIVVGEGWYSSSVVAGATNPDFPSFGNADDESFAGGNDRLLSSISSIVIGGPALGSVAGGDHFGFVAQKLGTISIGGIKQTIPAAGDFTEIGNTNDFAIHRLSV